MGDIDFSFKCQNEDFLIANNILGSVKNNATGIVVAGEWIAEDRRIFSGNTYIQAAKDSPALSVEGQINPQNINLSKKTIDFFLGDKTGEVYRMK